MEQRTAPVPRRLKRIEHNLQGLPLPLLMPRIINAPH
jgi:hypothetical protein